MTIATKFDWPGPAEMAASGETLQSELRARVTRFEAHFGFPSSEVRHRLDEGSLDESHEVVQWILAMDTLAAIERGQSA